MATQREKAQNRLIEVFNENRQLEGLPVMEDYQILGRFDTRKMKVYEIEDKILNLERDNNCIKYQNQINEYWETEEGKSRKILLEAQNAELQKRSLETSKGIEDTFMNLAKLHIGQEWVIRSWSNHRIEFGRVDDEGKRIFGQDFEIYFDRWNDNKPEINVGTTGAFEIDSDRAKFYTQFGNFLSHPEVLKEILSYHSSFLKVMNSIERQMAVVEAQLKDPIKNK